MSRLTNYRVFWSAWRSVCTIISWNLVNNWNDIYLVGRTNFKSSLVGACEEMEELGLWLSKLTVLAGLRSLPIIPLSYFRLTVLESKSLSLGFDALGGRLPRSPFDKYLLEMSYLSYLLLWVCSLKFRISDFPGYSIDFPGYSIEKSSWSSSYSLSIWL